MKLLSSIVCNVCMVIALATNEPTSAAIFLVAGMHFANEKNDEDDRLDEAEGEAK